MELELTKAAVSIAASDAPVERTIMIDDPYDMNRKYLLRVDEHGSAIVRLESRQMVLELDRIEKDQREWLLWDLMEYGWCQYVERDGKKMRVKVKEGKP